MANLLKGKVLSKDMFKSFRQQTKELQKEGIIAKIIIISATDDAGVATYIPMIEKSCRRSGVDCTVYRFDSDIPEQDILQTVKSANIDQTVRGIMVMFPVWGHLSSKKLMNAVAFEKDIDGINPVNAGRLVTGEECLVPNTAQACRDIVEGYGYSFSGKHVVIAGRSNIVGKPLANMLVQKGVDATVTLCHSRTERLKEICRSADILVAAIGSPSFITGDYTNPNQIVVDVGMNEITGDDGSTHLTGDVDFENVKDHVEAITPVPGGISPLTNAALIKNILKAVSIQKKGTKLLN